MDCPPVSPDNEHPQKRQRVGEGPDSSTDSSQSTEESVIVISSSSDESSVSSGPTSTVRFRLPKLSSPIRVSNRPVTKAKRRKANKRKIPKRKATPEREHPQKRQRAGEGPDTSTDSSQSTQESEIVVISSTDESTVSAGHNSTVRFRLPQSSRPIGVSNRPVIKVKRRKATKGKATKGKATKGKAPKRKTTERKATPEHEPPQKRQRVGEGPDTSSKSDVSTQESGPKVNSSSEDSTVSSSNTSRADFHAKYLRLAKLGEGGFGTVYAGSRRSDGLPVAIKYIRNFTGRRQRVVLNGKEHKIPMEAWLMEKATGDPVTGGSSAAVALLDWYELYRTVILVMERPVPSMDLLQFIKENNGPMAEDVAKNIMLQLVDAAIDLKAKGIFHRDIKGENILIGSSSDGLRVRVIDFGCGCDWNENTISSQFIGTFEFSPPELRTNKLYMAGPMTSWQLAALLFEMLDGSRRFFTKKFLSKEFQISSAWSKDCQDFMGKCLALEPQDRATLEEMRKHPWLTPG